jgi:hypothetical protein
LRTRSDVLWDRVERIEAADEAPVFALRVADRVNPRVHDVIVGFGAEPPSCPDTAVEIPLPRRQSREPLAIG